MPTYLTTSYAQRNEAKALGAKWDAAASKWYVPDGLDLAPFAKWLSNASAATPSVPVQVKRSAISVSDKGITLSTLLTKIGISVQAAFEGPVWVRAEISEIHGRGGHTYLDLVERNVDGVQVAKSRAAIWTGRRGIIDKFCKETGQTFSAGIKVLLSIAPKFSGQYGLTLEVVDIDPSFTLGEMEAKLRRIREVLSKEGIIDRNKRLPPPVDFLRVAVVSPDGAAGLGDFKAEADLLQEFDLCEFIYFTAAFQGEAAPESVGKAIREAIDAHKRRAVDALVIIRGGGAVADLHWLNDEGLARLVVTSPVPVFTGIGHERDNTILDEVSHTRFDTPSKVIAHVLKVITAVAQDGYSNMQAITMSGHRRVLQAANESDAEHFRIVAGVQQVLIVAQASTKEKSDNIVRLAQRQIEHAEIRGRQLLVDVRQGATWRPVRALEAADRRLSDIWRDTAKIVEHHEREAQRRFGDVQRDGIDLVELKGEVADRMLTDIRLGSAWRPVRAFESAERLAKDIRQMTVRNIEQTSLEALSMIEAIITRGPQNTLARGYTIVRSAGKVISSAKNAGNVAELEIEFQDGRLSVRRS